MNDIEKNNGRSKMWIALLLLIVLLLGSNGYYFLVGKSKIKAEYEAELTQAQEALNQTRAEKEALDGAFKDFKYKYDQLVMENDSLAFIIESQVEAISESKRKIDMLYARINQLKSDEIQNRVNEEALAEFSKERNRFLAKIDQLGKANEMLKIEVENLKNSGAQPASSKNINGFMATNITFQGIYDKKGQDYKSNKSKKVQRLKVGFYLTKNEKVNAGNKILYVRVLDPAGVIIAPTGSATINRLGSDIEYSIEREIEYPSDESFVYFIHPTGKLSKGVYSLEIYTDESLIGTKSTMFK